MPFITSPDGFGLYHRPIDQSGRRNLILVGKVLQNLANDALFGAKEAYMVGMNPFMGRALPQLQRYVSDLGQMSSVTPKIVAVDDRSTIEDQMRFHRILLKVCLMCITCRSLCFVEPALLHLSVVVYVDCCAELQQNAASYSAKAGAGRHAAPARKCVQFFALASPFCHLFTSFFLQMSILMQSDDPCDKVKEVHK